jgi:hypothetical protein
VKQIGELAAELRKVEQALAEFSAFAEQRAKHTSDFSGDFFSSLLKVRRGHRKSTLLRVVEVERAQSAMPLTSLCGS